MFRFANHSKRPATPNASAGFTIIEILIVLAIAGLILLLVFEALPALQRSGRNNQRRQDVQTILADISHYELNNSGDIPPDSAHLRNILNSPNKLNMYDPAPSSTDINITLSLLNTSTPSISMTAVISLSTVNIYNHAKCDPSSPGAATNTGAGYSDVVALYAIESGSSPVSQCQQL